MRVGKEKMGEGLIRFYHTKIKKEWKTAFVAAFVIGLLIHIYKFTNTLPGHDSLYNVYSSQNMVKLGRWFLAVACGFSTYFDLPWVIGLISLFWIGITAALTADIFRMENPVLIALTGGLLVAYPAVTQTFYFEFTADGYMMAMALAAFAVRCSMIGEKRKSRLFAAFLSIVFCCGIYQAYLSFALVLALCYFMAELLENRYGKKEYILWMRNQILLYGAGVAAYYVIWKLALLFQGVRPSPYLGIAQVGQIGPAAFLNAVLEMAKAFFSAFAVWNFLEKGLTVYTILNMLFLLLCAATVAAAMVKSRLFAGKTRLGLFLLSGAAIPFAAFIWFFASPGTQYSTRMEQSVCLLYILTAVLLNRWVKPKLSSLAALFLAVIILHNGITANLFYQYVHRCYERSYGIGVEIATRIHLLDHGNITSIMVVGETDWFDKEEYEGASGLRELGPLKYVHRDLFSAGNTYSTLFLSEIVGVELSYYREHPEVEIPPVDFSSQPQWPVPDSWEWRFPMTDFETYQKLADSEQVSQMGCWPAADAIQVIDHVAVVKLSETGKEE